MYGKTDHKESQYSVQRASDNIMFQMCVLYAVMNIKGV